MTNDHHRVFVVSAPFFDLFYRVKTHDSIALGDFNVALFYQARNQFI